MLLSIYLFNDLPLSLHIYVCMYIYIAWMLFSKLRLIAQTEVIAVNIYIYSLMNTSYVYKDLIDNCVYKLCVLTVWSCLSVGSLHELCRSLSCWLCTHQAVYNRPMSWRKKKNTYMYIDMYIYVEIVWYIVIASIYNEA